MSAADQGFITLVQQSRYVMAAVALATLWTIESVAPMFAGREHQFSHISANFGLAAINAVVSSVFAFAILFVTGWARAHDFGLLNLVALPVWLEWVAAIVLFDCWQYWWHRLNHRVPLFWRFHSVHHADAELDASSGVRFHTGEIVFSFLARLIVLPLIGLTIPQLLIYEALALPIVLFHHSNIRLPGRVDRRLRWLIVTPWMHYVHHSRWQPETDSNYSSFLSVWDRLFRSFRLREKPQEIELGLDRWQEHEWRRLPGMLAAPFRESHLRALPRERRPGPPEDHAARDHLARIFHGLLCRTVTSCALRSNIRARFKTAERFCFSPQMPGEKGKRCRSVLEDCEICGLAHPRMTDSASSPFLLAMLKAPRAGYVKTRLAREIGADAAAAIFRALVERQMAAIPSSWRSEVHVAPADAVEEMQTWLGLRHTYHMQVEGDLGHRLISAAAGAFNRGAGTVIIVGGDCPDLDETCLNEAAALLQRADVVLGPAIDGGYYLIGLTRPAPQIFADIPWSSPHVLEATVERIKTAGLKHAMLAPKEDIDDLASLRRVFPAVGETHRAGSPVERLTPHCPT